MSTNSVPDPMGDENLSGDAPNPMGDTQLSRVDLLAYLDELEPDISNGLRKNKASALGQFEQFSAKAGQSIDEAFGSTFKVNLSQFLASKTECNPGTISNLESLLTVWHGLYNKLIARNARQAAGAQMLTTFAGALTYCLEAAQKIIKGLTLNSLTVKAGITRTNLYGYRTKGILPSYSSFDEIQRLEDYLIDDLKVGIQRGLLTGFVSEKTESLKVLKEKAGKTEFGAYMSQCRDRAEKDPVRLTKETVPEGLGKEFSGFINYKTTDKISKLKLKRVDEDKWILRPRSEFHGLEWHYPYFCEPHVQNIPGQPPPEQPRFASTASVVFGSLLTYFGVLNKLHSDPKKASLLPELENFSLVHLVDPLLFNEVFDFIENRQGKLTGTHTRLIAFILTLLQPEHGYIWQQPEFGKKLLHPLELTPKQWHKWCDSAAAKIIAKVAELKGDGVFVEKVRDSLKEVKEYIDYIDPKTDNKSPITALRSLAGCIETEIEGIRTKIARYSVTKPGLLKTLYSCEVVLLLVTLLTYVPLRIAMFYKMKYQSGHGKTPNLYKRSNGRWAITFESIEFKNHRFLKTVYDVGIPRCASKKIEHYLENVRPYIDPKDTRDLLFIAVRVEKKEDPKRHKRTERGSDFLQTALKRKTLKHLPKVFGPHAARPLAASFVVLNSKTGNAFKVAADILNDAEDTVKKYYAPLVNEPGSDAYHDLIESIFHDEEDDDGNEGGK